MYFLVDSLFQMRIHSGPGCLAYEEEEDDSFYASCSSRYDVEQGM